MKILTVGCGNIGLALVQDLCTTTSYEISISDISLVQAEQARDTIDADIECLALDVTNQKEVVSLLQDFDIVVGLTPGCFGYRLLQAAIRSRIHCVDLSFMPENPLTLAPAAQDAGICIIPDCGVAPGLSNILVGHGVTKFEEVTDIQIFVGGIPEHPVPPLDYVITWSLEDLLEEYLRKATIIKDRLVIEVEALDGLELISFPSIGTLEAFFTDGLRTLLHSFPEIHNMWEKTLRYPGHQEKIKLLIDLGFFSAKPLRIQGVEITPRALTKNILRQALTMPGIRDILVLQINVFGKTKRRQQHYSFHLCNRYDKAERLTAMAQSTAFTASIIIQLLAEGRVPFRGIVPPERLGIIEPLFSEVLSRLEERNIYVIHHYEGE